MVPHTHILLLPETKGNSLSTQRHPLSRRVYAVHSGTVESKEKEQQGWPKPGQRLPRH